MSEQEPGLVLFDRARHALAEAHAVDEVKEIRDQAVALRAYYRQRDGSLEMANQCAEIKIRAERRLGELLAERVESHRPSKLSPDSTLPEFISRDQSSDWQAIARIPEPEFEAHIAETKEAGAPLTTAGVLRLGVHFSSATEEWETPPELFEQLAQEFGFELDVCATADNAKCDRFFDKAADGLSQEWTGVCWMNPPYGDAIGDWMSKAHASADEGATVVCLVPARTDTNWWWDHARFGEVRFLRGRLRFVGAESSAPFPSAVVILGRPQSVIWWER